MPNWMLDILITHKRLRGLTESQLRELIESATDIESLRVIKEHLEGGSFRYAHIQVSAVDMIERCKERAADILWREHESEARRLFLESVGDTWFNSCFVCNMGTHGRYKDTHSTTIDKE